MLWESPDVGLCPKEILSPYSRKGFEDSWPDVNKVTIFNDKHLTFAYSRSIMGIIEQENKKKNNV